VEHIDSRHGLPQATIGVPYSHAIGVFGGEPPYHWRAVSGELPRGMQLDPDLGTVTGIPSELVQDKEFAVELSSAAIATQSGTAQTHVWDMRLTTQVPEPGFGAQLAAGIAYLWALRVLRRKRGTSSRS